MQRPQPDGSSCDTRRAAKRDGVGLFVHQGAPASLARPNRRQLQRGLPLEERAVADLGAMLRVERTTCAQYSSADLQFALQ